MNKRLLFPFAALLRLYALLFPRPAAFSDIPRKLVRGPWDWEDLSQSGKFVFARFRSE